MLSSVWSVAMAAALGANPAFPQGPNSFAGQNAAYGAPPVAAQPVSLQTGIQPASGMSPYGAGGYAYGSPTPTPEYEGYGPQASPYGGYGGGAYGGGPYGGPMGGGTQGALPSGAYPGNEPLFPYDSQLPWMHGYFQEMPSYGGYTYYRPYNYKHVMPQAQTAGGWGLSPTMPYSQQFWHRYKQQAAMGPQTSSYRASAPATSTARTLPARPAPSASAPSDLLPASHTRTMEINARSMRTPQSR